uniref:BED-type domain-containing protein n=1 Tax=Glycine max TaxID=3847 RepID=K7MDE2_SOYBN
MPSNFLVSNTEVSISPVVTSSTIKRPPRHNGRRNRSEVSNHFNQLEPKSNKRAQCKYCDVVINYEKGTSSMLTHVSRCRNNPNTEAIKRQKTTSSLTNDGIINCPSLGKVCLTTNVWTSPQNVSYTCLTTNFIDNDRKLNKKILNFRHVRSHMREAMAKFVESCVNEWGLNHKRLLCWNNLVLKREHIHMCCCAHILNLIVNSGLKEIDNSILRIRAIVKYIRSSPSRLMSFKEYIERQNIEYKGHICLDVETRWSSTYLMSIWHGINYLLNCNIKDSSTHKMAKNMKEKYQKYWGDPNKLNMLLLIVVVLDPRSKVKYMNWEIDQLFDVNKENGSNSRLKSSLKSLFNEYNGHKGGGGTQDDTQQAHVNVPSYKKYPYDEGIDTSSNLNILDWWKVNLGRFPILSNIARELLAMHVSIVASESTFSTCGRVLDLFCNLRSNPFKYIWIGFLKIQSMSTPMLYSTTLFETLCWINSYSI